MKKYYKIEITAMSFWLKVIPLAIVVAVLFSILGFFIVDKKVMPRVTNLQNRGDVIIPSVIGLSIKDASDLLYDKGLFLSEDTTEYSDKPLKEILRQSPQEGKKVKSGHHVFVTSSKGPEAAIIPSLLKLSEGPAKSKLRKAGFSDIKVYQKYNATVPKGNAVKTIPPSPLHTSREGKILLFISKGPEPTSTVVPSLVGEMLSDATNKLVEAELVVGKISYSSGSGMAPGQIIRQSAAPGSNISLRSKVNLVVSAE